MNRCKTFATGVAALMLYAICAGALAAQAPSPAPGEPTLDELRTMFEKYRDVEVALADGYVPDPANVCVTGEMAGLPPEAGAMGIHFIRMDLLGITGPPNPLVDGAGTHTDFREPAMLLYEPQADGTLELVGIENLVFAAAWREAGHTEAPSFHGVPWDYMENDPATEIDEAHGFVAHYDRHVWLFRENPNGVFTIFNPNVTCEHHTGPSHH